MNNKVLKIILLAKQVPDTRNVGKDAIKEDGTINRGALPAIFNPDDLNALEQALRIKDKFPDTEIFILTMGPYRAADVIREALYRGADHGCLLSDSAFAGSDTLATSYALASAIKQIGDFDIIIAGSQAIDGDTAQVGPQVADKLGIPQITYTEELVTVSKDSITAKRRNESGTECVLSPLPCLITVNSSAATCRPRNAKLVMKYKHARTASESMKEADKYDYLIKERDYLNICEWNADNILADKNRLGLSGSPTKVKHIESVVLQTKESTIVIHDDEGIDNMIKKLINGHIIG